MSNDIALIWNQALLRADIGMSKGDIATDPGLQTAVTVSLLSDREALPGDKIPDGGGPRGWWGDAYLGFKLGSRLWLLKRTTLTQVVLNAAQDYALEALQWMIDDGVADSVSCVATQAGVNAMIITTTIVQGGASQIFETFWQGQGATGA
jgi:phage gp46-like protein